MKSFTILKVGYSVGIYGCSNEYFTCVIISGETQSSFSFKGMYGVEDRIRDSLKEKGYTPFYVVEFYGRLTRNDGKDRSSILDEMEALDFIKSKF